MSNLDGVVRVGKQVYAKSDRDGRWYSATVIQAIEGKSVNVKVQATGRMQACLWQDVRTDNTPPAERKASYPPPLNLGMMGGAPNGPRPAPRVASPRGGPVSPRLEDPMSRSPPPLSPPPVSSSPPSNWNFARRPRSQTLVAGGPSPNNRPPPPGSSPPGNSAAPPVPAERRRGATIMGTRGRVPVPASNPAPISSSNYHNMTPMDERPLSPRKLSAPQPMTRNLCPQCYASFSSKESLVMHLDMECGKRALGGTSSESPPVAPIRKATGPSQSPTPLPVASPGPRESPPPKSPKDSAGSKSPKGMSLRGKDLSRPAIRTKFRPTDNIEGYMTMKSAKGLVKSFKIYFFVQEGNLLHFCKSETEDQSQGWIDLDTVSEVESYTEKGIDNLSVTLNEGQNYLFRCPYTDERAHFLYWQDAFFHYQKENEKSTLNGGIEDSMSFLDLLDKNSMMSQHQSEEFVSSIILDPASPRSYLSIRGKSPPTSPTSNLSPRSPFLSPFQSPIPSPREEPVSEKWSGAPRSKMKPAPKVEEESEVDFGGRAEDSVTEFGEDDDYEQRDVEGLESKEESRERPGSSSSVHVTEYEFSESEASSDRRAIISSGPPKKALPVILDEDFSKAVSDQAASLDSLPPAKKPPVAPAPAPVPTPALVVEAVSTVVEEEDDDDTEELTQQLHLSQMEITRQLPASAAAAAEDEAEEEEPEQKEKPVAGEDDNSYSYDDEDEEDSSSWDPPSEGWEDEVYDDGSTAVADPSKPKPRWGGVNVMNLGDGGGVKLKKVSRKSRRKTVKQPLLAAQPQEAEALPSTFNPKALLKQSKFSQKKEEEEKLKKVEDLALEMLKEEEENQKEISSNEVVAEESSQIEEELEKQRREIERLQEERKVLEEQERMSMMRKQQKVDDEASEEHSDDEKTAEMEGDVEAPPPLGDVIEKEDDEAKGEETGSEEASTPPSASLRPSSASLEEEISKPVEVECPVCTEMNAPTESYCVECGSQLPKVDLEVKKEDDEVKPSPVAEAEAVEAKDADVEGEEPKKAPRPAAPPGATKSVRKIARPKPPPAKKALSGGGTRAKRGAVPRPRKPLSAQNFEAPPITATDLPKKERDELKLAENLSLKELQGMIVERETERESIESNRALLENQLQAQITAYEASIRQLQDGAEDRENDYHFKVAEADNSREADLKELREHWRAEMEASVERQRQAVEEKRQACVEEISHLEAEVGEKMKEYERRNRSKALRSNLRAKEKEFQAWEKAADEERQKRIRIRDEKAAALEAEEAGHRVERHAELEAALDQWEEERRARLEEGSMIESTIESEISDVDINQAKEEMNEARDAVDDEKAAELMREEDRAKVERGVRENYARKVSALDDAEDQRRAELRKVRENDGEVVSDDEEDDVDDADADADDAEGEGEEVVFKKGDKVFAKRRPQDTEWFAAKVEYATSEKKYLVSFNHNKSRTLCAQNQVRSTKEPLPAKNLAAPKKKKIPKKGTTNRASQRETTMLQRRSVLMEEEGRIKKQRQAALKERDSTLNQLKEEREQAQMRIEELEEEANRKEEAYVECLRLQKKGASKAKKKAKKEQKTVRKRIKAEFAEERDEIEQRFEEQEAQAAARLQEQVNAVEEAWEMEEEKYNESFELEENDRLAAIEELKAQVAELSDEEAEEEEEEESPMEVEQKKLADAKSRLSALEEDLQQVGVDQSLKDEEKKAVKELERNHKEQLVALEDEHQQANTDAEEKEAEFRGMIKQNKTRLRENADETVIQRIDLELMMIKTEFSKQKRAAEEKKERLRKEEEMRQKEMEEELRRQKEMEEEMRRIEEERERDLQEMERQEKERQEALAREEEEERQRQEEEEKERQRQEELRLEEERREEEIERQREEELNRQLQERIAMEEAEEKARQTESMLLEEGSVAPETLDSIIDENHGEIAAEAEEVVVEETVFEEADAVVEGGEQELVDAAPIAANSEKESLVAELEQMISDKEELDLAIEAEREAVQAKVEDRRTLVANKLTIGEGNAKQSYDAIMEICRDNVGYVPSQEALADLQNLFVHFFDYTQELIERCCEDERIVQMVHGLRDMRAASQLFEQECEESLEENSPLQEDQVAALQTVGDKLILLSSEAVGRVMDKLQSSAPVVTVDSELITASQEISERIEELRARIATLPPEKPPAVAALAAPKKKRIRSTAPKKVLPIL